MASILLALPAQHEDRLIPQLRAERHELLARCVTGDQVTARIIELLPSIAVVSGAATVLTAELIDVADSHGTRLLVVAADAAERARALALGLVDVLHPDADWTDVEQALQLAREVVPAPRPGRRGSVITVWGPVGSPGRSTVAAGIAAELCAAGHSVILADADSYAASQAIALGLLDEAPGFAAACRLAGVDGLSRSELDRIGQRVRIGRTEHWVLTGISRANRWPELSADRVTDVLAACRDWVDYTIVDIAGVIESDEEISSDLLAPRRNAAAIAALRAADVVVAVGRADPVGVSRFLRGYADLQEIVQTRRVRVVMNGVRSTAVGVGATAQLARTLLRFGGIVDCDFLPHDQGAVDASVLEGRPLMVVAPKSPLRLAIGELVERHLSPQQGARHGPGRRRLQRRALQAAG